MDQKALHDRQAEEKIGYDNHGLQLGSTTALSPPPPYTEGSCSSKREPLNSVFVVPKSTEKLPKDSAEFYNPYEHRNVKHATTFSETLFHILKASLGTGILAMPNAFHNAGYMVGLIGTLAIGFLCTYSIHILINSEYELCRRRKKPSMTYPETLEAALLEGPPFFRRFAPFADFVANFFLLTYQIGSCCIYFVFAASNIKAVMDEYIEPIDVRIYLVILFIPFTLINWVRNLKLLAPFSTFANLVTAVCFSIIAYYVFTDMAPPSERDAVAPFRGMPLFFGTVLFAMEAIGVVMPLENEMKEPHRFSSTFGVLNMAMLPITILYTLVGFFGYLRFGKDSMGSITLNLPSDELLAQAAKLMLSFCIFITHSVQCYVAIDIIWNQKLAHRVKRNPLFWKLAQSAKLMLSFCIFITHSVQCYVAIDIIWNQKLAHRVKRNPLFWEYVTRTLIVFTTFFFAAVIPNLELFISLVGAFALSTMGLSFPAMIQMLTFWDYYQGPGKILFFLKNFTVIIIAALGFTIGCTTSLEEIYYKFFATI